MKNTKRIVGILCVMVLSVLVLSGCGNKKCEVTFNYNYAGSKDYVVSVAKKDTVYSLSAEREGYVFSGWCEDAEGKKPYDFKTSVTGNKTLYAKWLEEPVTTAKVVFNYCYPNSVNTNVVVEKGGKVYQPNAAKREGYVLSGWYEDAEYELKFSFDTAVAEDVELYAKWVKQNTVSFDTNGSDTNYASEVILTGDSLYLPNAVAKDKANFLGWSDGAKIYQPGVSYKLEKDGNVTFVAAFDNLYKVKFFDCNGALLKEETVVGGKAATAPTVSGSNAPFYMTFTNWDSEFTAVARDLEVTAVYEYTASEDRYFSFIGYKKSVSLDENNQEVIEYLPADEGETIDCYYVTKASDVALPANVVFPKTHHGKPVQGIVNNSTSALPAFGNTEANSESLHVVVIPNTYKEIPNYTFYWALSLEEVIYEENSQLERIGQYAFAGGEVSRVIYKTKMEEIVIPASVKVIDNYAFYLNGASQVTFEENSQLQTISDYAFAGVNSNQSVVGGGNRLSGVIIPASVELIKKYAFANQPLEYLVFEDGSRIKEIQTYAFAHSNWSKEIVALKSVLFPASLEKMGTYVFVMNFSLQDVEFAEGSLLKVLDNSTFSGCSALRSVVLREGLQKIGNDAFKSSALERVIIPGSVTEIGTSAFAECTALKTIVFAEGDIDDALKIGNSAFAGSVNAVMVYDQIEIPARTSSIGTTAFAYASGLAKLTFEEGGRALEIGDFAFAAQDSNSSSKTLVPNAIKEVIFPTYLKKLGKGAFLGSIALEKVVFPVGSEVTEILQDTFRYCPMLKTISLHDGMTKIGQYAFAGYASALTYNIRGTTLKVSIPYTELKSITIPYTVTVIDSSAFNQLTGISSIAFAAVPEGETAQDLVINSSAFNPGTTKNTALTAITFPARLKTIGSSAFSSYVNLKTIAFAEGSILDKIDSGAFLSNSSLTSISLPATLTTLNTNVFKDCEMLSEVIIAEGSLDLTIGNNVFDHTALTAIHFPARLKTIGTNVFANCLDFAAISVAAGGNYASEDGILYNGLKTSIVLYPYAKLATLASFTPIDSVVEIGAYAFANAPMLKTVVLNNVIKLGDYAFYNCPLLESVDASSVTTLGKNSFSDCEKLNVVALNDNLTELSANLFINCVSLRNIDLPSTLQILSANAFQNTGLESVNIPSDVAKIDGGAFRNTQLTTVIVPQACTFLGSMSFMGIKSLETIVVEGDVSAVYGSAFHDCDNLKYVILKQNMVAATTSMTDIIKWSALGNVVSEKFVGLYVNDAYYGAVADSKIFALLKGAEKIFKLSTRPAESMLEGEATVDVTTNLNYEGAPEAVKTAYVSGSVMAAPVREGYTFEGWYTDAACTTLAPLCVIQTSTLYAKWTAVVVPEA